MAARLVLHIGAPKTATSSIQACFSSSRDALLGLGILYPGHDVNHVPHFLAPMSFPGPEYMERESPELWRRLKRDIAEHDGTALLSSEIVCEADVALGQSLIAELGVADVQIVLTLRPLDLVLPSTWQEYIKAGDTIRYDDWLSSVFSGSPTAETNFFWISGNLGELVERWCRIAGSHNLAVIVLDPRRSDRLYRDFESVLALPEGFLEPQPDDLTNRSMTAAESELVRQLNIAQGGDHPGRHGYTVLSLPALWQMLRRRPGADEPRLRLTRDYLRNIRRSSREFIAKIEASGAHVIGDIKDLMPATPPAPRRQRATDQIPIEAASVLASALMTMPHPNQSL